MTLTQQTHDDPHFDADGYCDCGCRSCTNGDGCGCRDCACRDGLSLCSRRARRDGAS